MSLAEHRTFTESLEKTKLSTSIVWALVAALMAVSLTAAAFCSYRAFLPLEIDPNEAWNAWQSQSLAHLYPEADALTINNYPPLYFYLLHAFSWLGAEEIYAGRALSLAASLLLTFIVYRTIIILGAARVPASAGAAWFLATLAGTYTGYVGMNDPHLLGLAVMGAGFAWFVARARDGRGTEPAILVMVLAGFIKHSLIALPASALIWLALDRPRETVRSTAFGLAAAGAGLLACRLVYGPAFFEQIMMPRAVGWNNLHFAFGYAKPLAGAAALCLVWLNLDYRSHLARKMAALLAITFASGFVQSLGDGLDVNAYFEFLFALAIGVGLMLSRVENGPASITLPFACILLATLALTAQAEPYRFILSRDFRQETSENASAVRSEVSRIRKIPGPVSCSVMLVCYWAGKPFAWDDFAMHQRVATGRWTEAEMKRQAQLAGIRFETIDDRTVW